MTSTEKARTTALAAAAATGNAAEAERLLSLGTPHSTADEDHDGKTPLLVAAQQGHNAVVKALLNTGAPLEATDRKNMTPLLLAVGAGQVPVVETLLNAGARLDSKTKGYTPLHLAAYTGRAEVAEVLLKAGAQVNMQNEKNGISPLYLAARKGHVAVVRVLLQAGAQVDLADTGDTTPLHAAASRRSGCNEVAEALLKAGAPVDPRNDVGNTPLHEAAYNGRTMLVKTLLKAGASPNAKNKYYNTPVLFAAKNGYIEITEALLKAGAPPDLPDLEEERDNPLHWAARSGRLECCQLLVAAGADLKALSTVDKTPSSEASSFSERKTATWLESVESYTAFLVPVMTGWTDVIEQALSAGRYDPDDCSREDRVAIDAMVESESADLVSLAALARGGWSPSTHRLHHAGVRCSVWTVVLSVQRMNSGLAATSVPGLHRLIDGSALPAELLMVILGFVARRDWPVPVSNLD